MRDIDSYATNAVRRASSYLADRGVGSGALKMQDRKMQDWEITDHTAKGGKCRTWKMKDKIAEVEDAGPGIFIRQEGSKRHKEQLTNTGKQTTKKEKYIVV